MVVVQEKTGSAGCTYAWCPKKLCVMSRLAKASKCMHAHTPSRQPISLGNAHKRGQAKHV